MSSITVMARANWSRPHQYPPGIFVASPRQDALRASDNVRGNATQTARMSERLNGLAASKRSRSPAESDDHQFVEFAQLRNVSNDDGSLSSVQSGSPSLDLSKLK